MTQKKIGEEFLGYLEKAKVYSGIKKQIEGMIYIESHAQEARLGRFLKKAYRDFTKYKVSGAIVEETWENCKDQAKQKIKKLINYESKERL